MRSMTRRAFVGVIPMYRALAVASMIAALLERRAPLRVVAVGAEGPGRRELAELVPDHGLRDEHGHVLAAIVHRDRVPDHLRHDRRPPRPRADDPLVASVVHLLDLLHEVVVDERPLLDRPRHGLLAPSLPASADDLLVGRLALPAG